MNKSVEEILQAENAHEVLSWIQQNPNEFTAEVGEHFNNLAKSEFEKFIIEMYGKYDADTHYDIGI